MSSYSLRQTSRNRSRVTLAHAAIALAIAVAALTYVEHRASSTDPSQTAAQRAGISGVEQGSPDGWDPCANFYTARDQFETDGESSNHVRQAFKDIGDQYGISYAWGDEIAFIAAINKRVCGK